MLINAFIKQHVLKNRITFEQWTTFGYTVWNFKNVIESIKCGDCVLDSQQSE